MTIQRQSVESARKKISYRAGSTNNLHRQLRTVHPLVQWEDKTQSVECDVNEASSVSTATVAAAAAVSAAVSTASCSKPPHSPKPETQSSMKQYLQKSVSPAKQNSIDEELAKMIALDFQPFSVVDDKGFRKFIHAIPSSKTKKSSQAYMTENMHHCKRGLKKPQQSV